MPIDAPSLSADQAAACAEFLKAAPDTLAGEVRRSVLPDDAPGAAWGDPAITVTCGVAAPAEFDKFSPCDEVNGVGWFVPDEVRSSQDRDAVLTTIGFEPRLQLLVPASYRPEGPAAAMAALAKAIKRTLTRTARCH